MTEQHNTEPEAQLHDYARQIANDQWLRFGHVPVPTGDKPIRRPRVFSGTWMNTATFSPRALLSFAAFGFVLLIGLNVLQRRSWDYNIEWYLGVMALSATINATTLVVVQLISANRTFSYRRAGRGERWRWERFLRKVEPEHRAALFRLVMSHRLNADQVRQYALAASEDNPNVPESEGGGSPLAKVSWSHERRWLELHAMREMLDEQYFSLSGTETCKRPGLLAFYTLYPFYEWEHNRVAPAEPDDCDHTGELDGKFAFHGIHGRYLWAVLCLRCAHRWQQTDVTVPQHVLDFVAERAQTQLAKLPEQLRPFYGELLKHNACTARYAPQHRYPKGFVFCDGPRDHVMSPHRTYSADGVIAHQWYDDDARASHGPVPQPGIYLSPQEEPVS